MEDYKPYISEIRKRLRITAVFFAAGFVAGFLLVEQIIKLFLEIFDLENVQITFTSPYQIFNLSVNTGLFLGILVATPVLITQLLLFIKPALSKKESKTLIWYLVISIFLYLLGFFFGLTIMKYTILSLSSRVSIGQVGNYWDIEIFLSQVLLTSAVLGLVFQLPLIAAIMVKFDWIDIKKLNEKRPYILVGMFVFIALLPPTDAFSLILMVVPLILLYEITLLILKPRKVVQTN